jgi:RNA polymerase sigma-70 factor, ECF subfamily
MSGRTWAAFGRFRVSPSEQAYLPKLGDKHLHPTPIRFAALHAVLGDAGATIRAALSTKFLEPFCPPLRRQYESQRVELKDMTIPHQLSTRSDAELLQLAAAGEEQAFLLLYRRLKAAIFRYVFYMTSSRVIAEEVTQEVFIALLKDAHNYKTERGDVVAFAFGIARNFIRRIQRRERPYEPFPEDTALAAVSGKLISESDALPEQMIRSELAERVQAAVASLPDHYRQVVVLCDLCELSYADTASRLRCAVGTIRSRLNRAHALLAEKLKPLRRPQPDIGAAGPEGCVV